MSSGLIYLEIPPRAPLAGAVECFWILQGERDACAGAEPILPDGRCEIVVNFAERFRRHAASGAREDQPPRLFVGPADGAIAVEPTGRIDVLGARIRPGAARLLLGAPVRELLNQAVPLDEVCGSLDHAIASSVAARQPGHERIEALERLLAERLNAGGRRDRRLEAAVEAILRSRRRAPVGAVARAVGVSPRQLERSFREDVGLGPKLLARLVRLQAVFDVLRREDGSWASTAIACGYADQAHLVHDFSRFTGRTPAALLRAPAALTQAFTRGPGASGSYKTQSLPRA